MSRGSFLRPPELVQEFLARYEGELATTLEEDTGVSHSTISRWRRGQIPTRLNPDTKRALLTALESLPRSPRSPVGALNRVAEGQGSPYGEDRLGFAAGALWAIERNAQQIVETAAAARARLLGAGPQPISPQRAAEGHAALKEVAARKKKRAG